MSRGRALITGASAGLGSEFARQLAAQGKDLVLVARRAAALETLAGTLRDEFGIDVDVIAADLSDARAPAALYETTVARGLDVDMLINNAGSAGPDLLAVRDWTAQKSHLDLMMTSYALLCHFFVPAMRERGYGRVLNVASVAGQLTVAGDCNYGPTKTYLIALSRSLSATVRDDGVHVMALCPGFTHTDFHQSERLAKMKRNSPGFFWYDADVVVREGLAALEKGKAVYVSGRLYRYLMPVIRMPFVRPMLKGLGIKI
ncbi:MAG TPA: SDR family NAD(P)-dependent oxidoreductase [Woeseiaceae bacterium]